MSAPMQCLLNATAHEYPKHKVGDLFDTYGRISRPHLNRDVMLEAVSTRHVLRQGIVWEGDLRPRYAIR